MEEYECTVKQAGISDLDGPNRGQQKRILTNLGNYLDSANVHDAALEVRKKV